MKEFMELIYKNWRDNEEDEEQGAFVDWEGYDEGINSIREILSQQVAAQIEEQMTTAACNIEKNAFIAGFAHATKCISSQKVDLGFNPISSK